MPGPVKQLNEKGLKVCYWASSRAPSISISKSYKDKTTQEWKETKYFFPNEIETLIKFLQEMVEFHKVRESPQHIELAPGAPVFDDGDDLPF